MDVDELRVGALNDTGPCSFLWRYGSSQRRLEHDDDVIRFDGHRRDLVGLIWLLDGIW